MIRKQITEGLKSIGIPMADDAFRAHIDEWADWYRGKVEGFSSYSVFNGISIRKIDRASLCMAKTIAEDWANLLLNERVEIAVDDERVQELLDGILDANRFYVDGNRTVEEAFATGTGAFSEWIDKDGNVRIEYHSAKEIYPLAWCGSRITECAVSSVHVRDGKRVMYVRMYTWVNGQMHIANRWLDYESGKRLMPPEDVLEEIDTGIRVPLFQIIQPNIANNIDTTSPMGISVFANAIDALKAVDIAFDSFSTEYLLGRKRLLVPMSMMRIEQTREGERMPMFDPNDLVYTAYEAGDENDGFHELSPAIRAADHITGLRAQLNMLSFKCGLGNGRYDIDKSGGVKTATEVVSEKSELYQSLCKHELVLRDALCELAQAVCACVGIDCGEVRITFDDSIIQDKAAQRTDAQTEVGLGLMSKMRYLTEIVGLGEDEAREELKAIAAEARVTVDAVNWFEDGSEAVTMDGES